ncbi:MAG: 50S ribosomal protein L19 [Patescibacteria group bacterium]
MNDEVKKDEATPVEATPVEPITEAAMEPVVEPVAPEAPIEEAPPADAEVKVIPHKDITSGMTIRLHEKISDISPKGEKRERIQVFEGMVLNVRGAGDSRSMTVRKMSGTVGVEKIFPLASPNIAKIEVVKVAKTRRGNLSFLRGFRRKLKEVWMK